MTGITSYLEVLLAHRYAARLVNRDPVLHAHPDFGCRLDRATHLVRNVIAEPNTDPTSQAAAIAAMGSIWRPVQVMDPSELRKHVEAILDAALTGHPDANPTNGR